MNYKLLGKSGLRVSELSLGTMTFGEEWGYGANREESYKIFKKYLEANGNFIDTANRYTEGTSEKYIGEFVKETSTRNELVLASKYSLFTQANKINDGGNHRKNMVQSLEGTLKRLQTDYLDVFYLHAWDFTTPEEEVLRGLDDLIRSGKVLYIAISDTPAWIVSKCNAIAELRGWSQFIALQVEYSLITRDAERDLIPMAKAGDIAITAWAPLAGGALTGKYLNNEQGRVKAESKRRSDRSNVIAQKVVDIAKDLNTSPGNVALKWMMQKHANVFPVIGTRKLEQLEDNLQSVNIVLTETQMKDLDSVSAIELGFPHDFLTGDVIKNLLHSGKTITNHRIK